jgi:hypothetical protein
MFGRYLLQLRGLLVCHVQVAASSVAVYKVMLKLRERKLGGGWFIFSSLIFADSSGRIFFNDRHCGLVVRVPGYRSRGQG